MVCEQKYRMLAKLQSFFGFNYMAAPRLGRKGQKTPAASLGLKQANHLAEAWKARTKATHSCNTPCNLQPWSKASPSNSAHRRYNTRLRRATPRDRKPNVPSRQKTLPSASLDNSKANRVGEKRASPPHFPWNIPQKPTYYIRIFTPVFLLHSFTKLLFLRWISLQNSVKVKL